MSTNADVADVAHGTSGVRVAGPFGAGRAVRRRLIARDLPRAHAYPLLGLVLAWGALLGLLLVRAAATGSSLSIAWARVEISRMSVAYAYIGLSAGVALPALGLVLGLAYDQLHLLSVTDPLTGLYNRRHFGERLAAELARARRHGHTTCVLCMDLDQMKAINDDLGHGAGDRALQSLGRNLVASTRASDVVARMGGDEFAVLMPETSAEDASTLSQRILEEAARPGVGVAPLRISMGIASSQAIAEATVETLLSAADSALYLAKAGGGCRAVLAATVPGASAEPSVGAWSSARSKPGREAGAR